ncbi:MAG: hypothetical protein KatS3mg065_0278 [Chloroflexota bacterium]|nr:MAG: hypothetical protein KatS3mg065_0278 [Chloroflexota bacterium]
MEIAPGRWARAWSTGIAGVDDDRPGLDRRRDLRDRERPRLRHPAPEEARPGLVRRAHPGEVARKRRLATEEAADEGLDVGRLNHPVVAPLVADGRERRRGDPRRAERAGAVGREDGDVVLVGEDDLVEGAIHRPGEGDGVLGPEEVGPPDGADEERAAGEEEGRLGGPGRVGDGVGDVLGGVAGRFEGPELEGPDAERLAVADRPVLVAKLRPGADDVGRPGQGRQLPAPGDVVVVEVGLDDVADPEVPLAGRGKVDVDVAPGIDDGREPGLLVGDEGRQVSKPLDDELSDLHRRPPGAASSRRRRRRESDAVA